MIIAPRPQRPPNCFTSTTYRGATPDAVEAVTPEVPLEVPLEVTVATTVVVALEETPEVSLAVWEPSTADVCPDSTVSVAETPPALKVTVSPTLIGLVMVPGRLLSVSVPLVGRAFAL
jgi:hypothetical protein